MANLFGIGGSAICLAIAGAWAYYDKPSLMAYGWLVVIGLGAGFTGLVTLFQRDR